MLDHCIFKKGWKEMKEEGDLKWVEDGIEDVLIMPIVRSKEEFEEVITNWHSVFPVVECSFPFKDELESLVAMAQDVGVKTWVNCLFNWANCGDWTAMEHIDIDHCFQYVRVAQAGINVIQTDLPEIVHSCMDKHNIAVYPLTTG